jgi:putative transposase
MVKKDIPPEKRMSMITESQSKQASWELPDPIWEHIEPLIPPRRSKGGRLRSVDFRRITEGIFYLLRTGIHWQALPREPFGLPSTVYYYFSQWVKAGVFERLWAEALTVYDDLVGLEWTWQSVDGAMTKAPLGGRRLGPIPRTVARGAPNGAC